MAARSGSNLYDNWHFLHVKKHPGSASLGIVFPQRGCGHCRSWSCISVKMTVMYITMPGQTFDFQFDFDSALSVPSRDMKKLPARTCVVPGILSAVN